jgi:hypothetical protein
MQSGEAQMNASPKRKPRQRDPIVAKRVRQEQEQALDDALKNTFPASDPISVEQPVGQPWITTED